MRTALLQMTAGDDPAANLRTVSEALETAAADGVGFVLTPEVTNCVSASRARQLEVLRTEEDEPLLAIAREKAAAHGLWLLLGSLAVKTDDPDGRFANRSFLIDSAGEIAARYDKIHMFDVTISEAETYAEFVELPSR